MIDKKSVSEVLNFLQVPRTRRTRIIEDVTTESVKALYSLHQIRYLAFRLNMHKTSAGKGKMTYHKRDGSGESTWRLRY